MGHPQSGLARDTLHTPRPAPPHLLDTLRISGEPGFSADAVLKKGGLEKYKIGREIGHGSMGTVCLARDLNFRRIVAMKRMPREPSPSKEDLIRFIEEAQITSQLEHPHIMPVHDLGMDDDGQVYYTMKYVRGKTLGEILTGMQRGDQNLINQYPLSKLLIIFQKICDAIAFAHANHVLHRDLKPQNVMIGDFGEVLVMDLGLAKVIHAIETGDDTQDPRSTASLREDSADSTVDVTSLLASIPEREVRPGAQGIESIRSEKMGSSIVTLSGRAMGTPGFMAPEQVLNRQAGFTSDIYSLGGILYAILTLESSVSGIGAMRDILEAIVRGHIDSPVERIRQRAKASGVDDTVPSIMPHCPDGQIPQALSDIVMKAMASDPSRRYPSVQELQRDLEAFQNGETWNLVIDDDFTDPNVAARWTAISGDCEIADGELRLHGGGQNVLLLKQAVAGDILIEFECRQESLYVNELGCFMSAIPSDHSRTLLSSGYVFQYGASDNSINQLLRSEQPLWTESASPLVRGETYLVQAERTGSRLRLAVNGREIFEVTDKDPLTGKHRTSVGITTAMADTRFSRIRIYTRSTPWKGDILDFADRELQKGHYATAMDLYRAAMESFAGPERLQHAKQRYETATARFEMENQIPFLRKRLSEAWGATVDLRMDNDGLVLDITQAGLQDLEPLRGVPLTKLYCMNNLIADLSPLRGMPLRILHCGGNPLTSLEPLRGLPIETLLCEECLLPDIEPLRDVPLVGLRCSGNKLRSGLAPLEGKPVNWIICSDCAISSLEPLRGMPLSALLCDTNDIADLEPLRGAPLTTLHCDFNRIESLEPLLGMPLEKLHAAGNRIVSLEPLRGMPLSFVSCQMNRIESLEPLGNSPVEALVCANNPLETIEPFIERPPHRFLFHCDTIPGAELEKAVEYWSRYPELARLARDTQVLLALRRRDIRELRQMAAEHNGHRYLFIPRFHEWRDAKEFCERLDGHLVTITSKEEHDFVDSLMPGGSWFWIGLWTDESGPHWVSGEPYTFSGFRDAAIEALGGPKVFDSGAWSAEASSAAQCCFMIEWDR